MLLGKGIAKHHRFHCYTQWPQKCLSLICHTTRKSNDFREKDINKVCYSNRQVMNIMFHHFLSHNITLDRGIEGGSSCDSVLPRGQRM